jgi:hypothetical protein
MNISLNDMQAIYTISIENNSEYTIEDVYCPYLGDIQHPPKEQWFKTFLYQYASAQEWTLWPNYQNMRGYYGFD